MFSKWYNREEEIKVYLNRDELIVTPHLEYSIHQGKVLLKFNIHA